MIFELISSLIMVESVLAEVRLKLGQSRSMGPSKPCCKAVLSLLRILHIARALGQLDIIFDSKDGKSLDAARNKAGEIKVELDSDETNLLAASHLRAVLNWQKDGQIVCIGGIVHLRTHVAVKRQDSEVSEVEPIATKVASPIAENTVKDGTQIELSTKSIKHGSSGNAGDGEGNLVCLKCVGALWGEHGLVDHRVELDGVCVHLDGLKGPRHKHEVWLQQVGASIRHGGRTD
jgi:hypothetical protein